MNKFKIIPTSLRRRPASLDERVNLLVHEMLKCCESNKPINLSLPSHHETTEALHRLVYMDGEAASLKVIYNDGTKGDDFPVRLLWKPPDGWDWQPKDSLHLQIGTLSFRHVEYDRFVDFYLVRDKETRRLSQAEIQKLAHDRMKELLESALFRQECYLTIYQAGLEPLAVGVYRALTESVVERTKQGSGFLRVRPIYVADESGEFSGREPLSVWGAGWNENV